jgi:alpha-beta hydrolase superfamily lysophospholipase
VGDTTFTLDTRDGVPVTVHRWLPDGEVRGVINLAHGMAEHAARYARFAAAANERGLAVYAEDHRGHGETARTEDELGHFADERGWALVLDDLHRVTERARAEHPDVPLVLLGHSMGSFLAQQYLFTFPDELDAVVLSGTNGPAGPVADAGALVARAERRRLGRRGRSTLLDQLTFGAYNKPYEPSRTRFDWLSRDPEEVDRYVADPWCGFIATTQFYIDLLSGVRLIGQVDRIREGARPDLPVYIFAGTDDPVGGEKGIGKLLDLYEAGGLYDVTHRLYPGGRHEMLNESNRDEVTDDVLGWIQTRVLEGRR